MRLFVALNLSDAVRGKMRSAIDDFPLANPPWRWTSPDTWHITLKFLGETAPADLARVTGALAHCGARHAPFDLVFAPFGGFPNLRAPRVLFYALARGEGPCAALARDVDQSLFDAIGLERETRRFHAHATLARVKERLPDAVASQLGMVRPLTDAVSRVDGFVLMQSRLRRTGAEYSVVKEFALSGAG